MKEKEILDLKHKRSFLLLDFQGKELNYCLLTHKMATA